MMQEIIKDGKTDELEKKIMESNLDNDTKLILIKKLEKLNVEEPVVFPPHPISWPLNPQEMIYYKDKDFPTDPTVITCTNTDGAERTTQYSKEVTCY